MTCNLYIRQGREETKLGQFKSREAAEDFFRLWSRANVRLGDPLPKPIYVETGKGRGKK